jgi:hypothetical protein
VVQLDLLAIKPGTGTPTGTGTGTGTKPKVTKPDTGIAPLTFTDTDNGDGTITRRYSDGTIEIIAGGRGSGSGTDCNSELLTSR